MPSGTTRIGHAGIAFAMSCAFVLVGCGGPGPVRVDVPAASVAVFDFQDMRPAEQRSDRRRFDEDGQRYILGERDLEPAPAELVRAWFARKLSSRLPMRTLVLESFIVRVPAPIAERATPVEVEIAGSIGGQGFEGSARSTEGHATRADVNATIVEALNHAIRSANALLDGDR